MTTLAELETPCLLLDYGRLTRNVERMRARCRDRGVLLRPHVNTPKSLDVARLIHGGTTGPITVSTLREAVHFAADRGGDVSRAPRSASNKGAPRSHSRGASPRRRGRNASGEQEDCHARPLRTSPDATMYVLRDMRGAGPAVPQKGWRPPFLTTRLRCSFDAVTDLSRAARRASQEGSRICNRSHNDGVALYAPRRCVGRSSRATPGSTTNDTLRGHAKRSSRATWSRWRTGTNTRNTTSA
jgi:hypothetical protein